MTSMKQDMMKMQTMTVRRGAIALGAIVMLSATTAGAQTSGGGSGAGGGSASTAGSYRKCTSCGDSVRRVFVRHRLAESERLQRALSAVKRKLEEEGLDQHERSQLTEALANLTLALAEMSTRIAVEVSPGVMELTPRIEQEMRRGLAETRRALISIQPDVLQRFAPKGWLGLNVNGEPEEIQIHNGEMFLRFADFPSVVSVDPNSPAERAGIQRGDLLMAYNGMDVRSRLAMNRILEPGKTVTLRVRRNGDARELKLVPMETPAHIKLRRTDMIAPLPPATAMAGSGRARVSARTPRPSEAPSPSMAVFGVQPGTVVYRTPGGFAYGNDAFVGAELATVTDDYADILRVDKGVVVLRLLAGTPAAAAGLRPFDVIIRANDRDVATIALLREIVARRRNSDGPGEVVLDVMRSGQKRTVKVKWND
jgi:membrane-associated protease RseP (regulator of RpoE activity)